MTISDVFEVGLALEDTEESTYYGSPCVKRAGKVMFVARESEIEISLRLDWEWHDAFLDEFPELFYKTDHLDGWPWLYVRIAEMSDEMVQGLIEKAWISAPLKVKNRPKGFGV